MISIVKYVCLFVCLQETCFVGLVSSLWLSVPFPTFLIVASILLIKKSGN